MRTALVMAVLVGCGGGGDDKKSEGGDKDDTSESKPPSEPTARDAVVEAWKQGGLKPSEMTAATVPIGKDCQAGTVDSVEVVLCLFKSAADAKAAEKPGWDWIGATTGTAWVANGTVVVAVADRKKADPHGKTINQLMKLAPK